MSKRRLDSMFGPDKVNPNGQREECSLLRHAPRTPRSSVEDGRAGDMDAVRANLKSHASVSHSLDKYGAIDEEDTVMEGIENEEANVNAFKNIIDSKLNAVKEKNPDLLGTEEEMADLPEEDEHMAQSWQGQAQALRTRQNPAHQGKAQGEPERKKRRVEDEVDVGNGNGRYSPL